MKEQKEKIKTDKAELNENELEKVDGGMKVIIIGAGKMGMCERCGIYAYIVDGLCEKCRKNK